MPPPSKRIPKTATPTKQPHIVGQSSIDGFLSVSRPLIAPNDNDDYNAESTANGNYYPLLKRKRKIRDDDDDKPMVNITLAANDAMNPVVIADTENESDAHCGVILPQRQLSNHETANGSKSQNSQSKRKQWSAPAELEVSAGSVCFGYSILVVKNCDYAHRTTMVLRTTNLSLKTKQKNPAWQISLTTTKKNRTKAMLTQKN